MSTHPVFSRNSFVKETPNRDIYSYEFLSKPFSVDDSNLPQVNTNATNSQQVANSMHGENPAGLPKQQINRGANNMNGIYAGVNAAGAMMPKQDYTSSFGQYSETLQKRAKVEKGFETGENAIGAIPVLGTAIAGFSKIGRGIGAQTVDKETGIYKSKAGAAVDSNFNPVSGVSGAIDIHKDLLSLDSDKTKVDWSNILNYATMGILGKSAAQTKLKKEKAAFDHRNQVNKLVKNDSLNALANSDNQGYQAESYGNKGMKIRTKLSIY